MIGERERERERERELLSEKQNNYVQIWKGLESMERVMNTDITNLDRLAMQLPLLLEIYDITSAPRSDGPTDAQHDIVYLGSRWREGYVFGRVSESVLLREGKGDL